MEGLHRDANLQHRVREMCGSQNARVRLNVQRLAAQLRIPLHLPAARPQDQSRLGTPPYLNQIRYK